MRKVSGVMPTHVRPTKQNHQMKNYANHHKG